MRKEMREATKRSDAKERLSERTMFGDQLFEKWSRKNEIGEGMDSLYEKDSDKARALSIILENQENHMTNLTETQISNSFGTTPENVLRVVRLGYPNSVRGELFLEWAMETARDSIYYLSPVYQKTARGATANDVTHESDAYRYASEIEEEVAGAMTAGAIAGTLTGPLSIRPYTVTVFMDGVPIGSDDGAGNLIGATLDASTIDYTTGDYDITVTGGTTEEIMIQYNYDSEVDTNYDELGSVELMLKDYQFRVKPMPLYVSWSKMTELLINTTLNIDAEDALIRGAGEELKKSLDFQSVRMAYRAAGRNAAITFDGTKTAGDTDVDKATTLSRAIDNASDVMFDTLQRGGVTHIVGGPAAVNYAKLHKRFTATGAQPKVGIHKVGEIDGVSIYKAPKTIVADAELLCIYHNDQVPEDVSLAFGSLIPLYKTQTLEHKNFYKETGLAHFGDGKVLQGKYLVRILLTNIG
jgi:hypothetical protein